MADDRKRSENVCSKVTERMVLDINRLCAMQDIKPSTWLFQLMRRELYGLMVKHDPDDGDLQD